METLSRNGAQYRTQLMDRPQAEAFARCLKANPRFDGIFLAESARAKTARRWFVTYVPTSLERRSAILDRQQDARARRAQEQGARYEFVLDSSGRWSWCLNRETGEVYETTESDCNCPDHHYRCRPAGILCKHVHMLTSGAADIRGWDQPARYSDPFDTQDGATEPAFQPGHDWQPPVDELPDAELTEGDDDWREAA